MTEPLRTVEVVLGDRSYDVLIGPGARHELSAVLPASAERAVIVTQAGIGVKVEPGIEHEVVEIGRGERSKSMATVEELGRGFSRFGLTRSDVVIAVGGGLVTDVAGFAAASFHRGTPVVHVATTLLAQVDAAIGGKTGVNLPEGKNLMGAFWQPHAVICDTETLATLPPEEWRSGLGEMAKYAFIGVEDLPGLPLEEQVAACVELKARVVSADERESGLRMVLNYGHTLAHALEAAGFAAESGDVLDRSSVREEAGSESAGTALRHGEAVAIGVVFAARLARALGRIDDARVRRHDEVVAGYELGSRLPHGAEPGRLIEFMLRDKKAHGGLAFVLDGPQGVELVTGVDAATVTEVMGELKGS
ncbi:MAG: 3-dehydroquinate synthase family protein [Acidimicrobiales bacterium]|jgi:5-deoxy-5-amino-3-dehydroquinate synthase